MTIREIYATYRKPRDLERSEKCSYRGIDRLSRAVYGFCGSVLVWLLLPTRVTANQVSVVAALIGLASSVLLASPSRGFSLLGVVLIQLFVVLDWTDGTLARARKTSSTQGRVFDNLFGELVGLLPFVAIGLHDMFVFRDVRYVYLGFGAALAAIMLRQIYNVKILSVLVREKDRVREILANRSRWSGLVELQTRSSERSWKRQIGEFSDLLWVSRYFIKLLCIAYLFEITYLFTIFYGIAFPLRFLRTLWVELTSDFHGVYAWIANSKDARD